MKGSRSAHDNPDDFMSTRLITGYDTQYLTDADGQEEGSHYGRNGATEEPET
jgi:hypothetical protein